MIEQLHYDVKFRFNKIDSNQNRNLLIPEIDIALNEATEMLVKSIAMPRLRNNLGFELNQRNIDDLSPIVINQNSFFPTSSFDSTSSVLKLPEDYWFHISSITKAKKGSCEAEIRNYIVQHDDMHTDLFSISSFEWREINVRFFNEGLRLFTDGTFSISGVKLNYIKKLKYIHYAQGRSTGNYTLPDGTILTGKQDPELPNLNNDVVDLAVAILSGIVQSNSYNIFKDKLVIGQNLTG